MTKGMFPCPFPRILDDASGQAGGTMSWLGESSPRQACREAQQTDASSICRVLLAAAKPGDIRTLMRVRSSPATPIKFRSGSACRGKDACPDAGLSANGEA